MRKKYLRFISTLFIVVPMSFIMALVGTLRNVGLAEGWYWKLITSWMIMLPVAFFAAWFIIPPAKRLAEKFASR